MAKETTQTPAEAAASLIMETRALVQVTAGGVPGAVLPKTKFGRLSVERRVLGHVTDEVDDERYGPRNTLAALSHALMTDPNTTNPTNPEAGRLKVDGTLVETVETVLAHLDALVEAELIVQHKDGSYKVTAAGHEELGS